MERGMINSQKIFCSLIIKDGFIVQERYSDAFSKDTPGEIYSVTKSFLSALFGIAVEKKYLNLQDAVVDYFDDFVVGTQEFFKEDVTIENLLTMTSGIFCPTNAGFNNRMSQSKDELNLLLRLPLNRKNIGKFSYNDANYNLLANILFKATQKTPLEFAQETLFDMMEIPSFTSNSKNIDWEADAKGVNYGGFGLKLCGRDMAKLGYLYLEEGLWKGQRLVQADWILQSTSTKVPTNKKDLFYGYGWWVCNVYGLKTFYAIGAGGQYIICTPELNLVQVFLCEKNSMAYEEVDQLWRKTIKEFMEQKVDDEAYKNKECIFA